MSYCGFITKIKGLRKHTNADKLQVGQCFGNETIVGLDVEEGQLGLYLPTDGRLGLEFATENKLVRTKDTEGNHLYGYLDPDKLHVSAIKLRGEKSDGLYMGLTCLEKFTDISKLKEGDTITLLNGTLICEKYIPRGNQRRLGGKSQPKDKINMTSYPNFKEHIDTAQLSYNMHVFKPGDLCQITLKMHGTSQRTSHTIKETKKVLPYWVYKALQFLKIELKPKKKYELVTGTRRVVLKDYNGGFYGDNSFRRKYHDFFDNKLQKGECIYYEVLGYSHDNQTIMPECDNKKTKDKEFIKEFGEKTRFTYGCQEGQNDIYAYRMTITNEDGFTVEYPDHLLKLRCEQMGVKVCPEFDKFLFTTQEDLMERVNRFLDGADPIGKTHIKEGVVVRIINKERFAVYKHKSFLFKVLEGLIKADDVLDMEEAENIEDNSI